MNRDDEPPLYRVLFGFLGAIIGGFLVLLIGGHELHVTPVGVTYGDLAAIALTAVTVLLAVFGLAAAFAALYGYREFMRRSAAVASSAAEKEAKAVATETVKSHLDQNFDPDLARRAQTIATRIITPEYLRALIVEQIDALSYGNVRDEKLDEAAVREGAGAEPDELDALDEAVAEEEHQQQNEHDGEAPAQ